MSRFEEVLFHPLYDSIKKKCFEDMPSTQISNWVKNTVDEDATIPSDKKAEYYLSDKKISAYKGLLKEQTKAITVDMPGGNQQALTVVTPGSKDAKITTDEGSTFAPILVKDIEKNVMVINETFFNLFEVAQGQLFTLMASVKEFGFSDPQMTRNIRSLVSELRQLLELWCKISGREDFARTLGAGAGQAVVQNMLSDTAKQKLKEWVRDLLAMVDPQIIPQKLSELEEIINGPTKQA